MTAKKPENGTSTFLLLFPPPFVSPVPCPPLPLPLATSTPRMVKAFMVFFSSSELRRRRPSFCEVVFDGLVHKRVGTIFPSSHSLSLCHLCPKNQKKNKILSSLFHLCWIKEKKLQKKKKTESFERKTLRKEIIATVVEYQRRERIEKSRWPSPRTTRHTISRIKRTEMVREKSRVFLRVASWEVSPRSIARNRKCVGRGALLPGFHFVA